MTAHFAITCTLLVQAPFFLHSRHGIHSCDQEWTQRLHEYVITALGTEADVLGSFKLKPGVANPFTHPQYDNTLPSSSSIVLGCSKFNLKATTHIITKEGFLPLTKELDMDVTHHQWAQSGENSELKKIILEHQQVMEGNKIKGGGIETEFNIT